MRNIDENIWRDDWFADQEPTGKLLWIGILTKVADDQGRFRYNPELVKSDLFPMSKNPDAAEIDLWLAWFVTDGKLLRYEVGGRQYMQVLNWWKYQAGSAWMSASQYPAPEGWQDCWRYHGKGNSLVQSPNWAAKTAGFASLPSALPSQLPSDLPSPQSCDDININSDSDINTKEEEEAQVFKFFENNIQLLTPYNSQVIGDFIQTYTATWTLAALQECVAYNAKSLKYAEAILKGWQKNGFKTSPQKTEKKPPAARVTNFEKNKAIVESYLGGE